MKNRILSALTSLLLLVSLFNTSCKPSDTKEDTKDDPVIVEAESLEVVSGNNQTADAGTELSDPIVFVVKGSDGKAIKDVKVEFATAAGALSVASATSDTEGKVSISWTLGAEAGRQTFTATAFKPDGTTNLTGSPVTIIATAKEVVQENTFTDTRDNKVYKTVQIGTQNWMQENLNFEKTGAAPYANDAANATTYGLLYTAGAAQTACPAGWHLPSDTEWKTLEMAVGMSQEQANFTGSTRGTDEGGKLKETGTTHWKDPNTGATNTSEFSVLGAGYNYQGTFYQIKEYAYFWTSTEGSVGANKHYSRQIVYNTSKIGRTPSDDAITMSVRCVED